MKRSSEKSEQGSQEIESRLRGDEDGDHGNGRVQGDALHKRSESKRYSKRFKGGKRDLQRGL